MTPPRMPDHRSEAFLDMTPAYPPDADTDEIVDMTPADLPEGEPDDFEDMAPTNWAGRGDSDEFTDMIPAYAPGQEPWNDSARSRTTSSRASAPPPRPPAQEERDERPRAGGGRGKYVVLALLGLAVLLFVGNKVLGSPLSFGPLSSAGTGGPQPTTAPIANTPTAPPINIGNRQFPTTTGPLLLLNPGVVRQGTQVSVTGSGFDPGSVVDLTITRQGSNTPLANTFVQADKGGTFAGATLNVPTALGSGNFLVVAKERNSNHAAQAVGEVAGGAPTVKLGEQVGQPGDMVVLALHGFAPGETINVYWNAMSGQPLTTFKADGGGGVGQAKLQVPIGAVGQNTFLFVGAKSQSVVAANFLVLQLYPTVKPSTYALRADNVLSFSGSGFGPGERVFIFLNNTASQPLGVVSADSHGTFKNAAGFVVPFQLKGKQTLIFMGEQSHATDSISFTVEPYNPVITPSTYGGSPGTTISFFVTGFARNEVVHIYAGHTKSAMGNMVGCFMTNDHGAAAAVGSYLIPGTAQGQLGFALVGVKSGGVGVATINISAPPVPVQTPPQPAFTCPLDAPAAQQPGAQQPGAPDQNQQQPNQPQQNQPDQNQQNQQQQQNQPAGPQGSVAQPSRQAAVSTAVYGLAYLPTAFNTTGALQLSSNGPVHAKARLSAGAMAHQRLAAAPRLISRLTARDQRKMAAQSPISPALAELGLLWVIVVVTLTVVVIRRSSRQEVIRHEHTGNGQNQANVPSATLVIANGACPEPSEGNRALSPQLAARLPTTNDEVARRLPTPADKYQPDGTVCLASAPSGYDVEGSTAHAAWQTARLHGDKCQGRHDTTLVQTNLTQAGANQTACALFLLADGRSTSDAGSGASRIAVESIARHVIRAMNSTMSVPPKLIMPMFKYAVTLADGVLLARNAARRTDMTTTVTGAMLVGRRVYVVNVGDSRTYVYSPKGGLWQLTKDHSVVFGLVTAGFLCPEALDVSRPVRRLYRSLGDAEHPIHVDSFEMRVSPGDLLLFCSDGLWRHVSDRQIEATLRTTADPRVAAQTLTRQATEAGCEDDATAIVVRIPASTLP